MNEITQQLLICLATAHFAGDFLFQCDEDPSNKRELSILLKHTGIVSALSYVLCGTWVRWEIPLAVFVTHFIIDFIKSSSGKQGVYAFLADQIAHIIVTIMIAVLITMTSSVSLFWGQLLGKGLFRLLILVSGIIVTVKGGSILLGLAVKPFQDQIRQCEREVTGRSNEFIGPRSRGFESGGQVIGQLERALIFLFIFVNQPIALGFLIAAKSIFRFGELKEQGNRLEAEYIIIGTLMSFLYAMIVAYATKYLLELV